MDASTDRKAIGILQPSFLPWLGFFEQLYRSDVFVLYDDVQFEKGSWRNRNRIKTSNGIQWLTVPVLQKGLGPQLIKDVQINPGVPWQKKQTRTITQNYLKAPFFEKYADNLFDRLNRPWERLVELNVELIAWIATELGISTKIVLASELDVLGSGTQRLIDVIKAFNGTCFYEGSAGRNYIDDGLFEKNEISIIYQDYDHPTYPQLYGDFVSYLSIIDLMFNCGEDSLEILTSV
jgi:hypothetical protein